MNPVPGFSITTPYGMRGPHWSCRRDSSRQGVHTGADFAAPIGTTVVAARPGTVKHVNHGAAFGNHQIEVVSEDGTSDFYAHMSKRVAHNTKVVATQKVGEVGDEGNATGPHLHFERFQRPGFWGCFNNTDPQPSIDWSPRLLHHVRMAHASLQFSLSRKEKEEDIERIFERCARRGAAWITGTEAGRGAGGSAKLLLDIGHTFGYTLWVPSLEPHIDTDAWIAVSNSMLASDLFKTDYLPVIPSSRELYKRQGVNPRGKSRWSEKGLVTVEFDTVFGRVGVAAAHYLHRARNPQRELDGINHFELNRRMGRAVAAWGREAGEGTDLAFYGGDQNMNDGKNGQPQGDTFFGAPFTSCWDELQKWPDTGHGTIDVIATYNRDNRVKITAADALNDKKFRLHQDHYLVEASAAIVGLPGQAAPRVQGVAASN